jgi:hypothetical protein
MQYGQSDVADMVTEGEFSRVAARASNQVWPNIGSLA